MMAFAMQSEGMREISILHTLIYRNRAQNGIEFIDEELHTWAECLHRYEHIQAAHKKLKPKSDSVKASVNSIYTNSSVFGAPRPTKRKSALLQDEELDPPVIWCGEDSN
jgi:hypothetical protein